MVYSSKTSISELVFAIEKVSCFFKISVGKDMDPKIDTSPFLVWNVILIRNVPWEETQRRAFLFVAAEKKDYYTDNN